MSDYPRPAMTARGWTKLAAGCLIALGCCLMVAVLALMGGEGSKSAQIAIGAWIAGPAAIGFAARRRLLSATLVLVAFVLLVGFAA